MWQENLLIYKHVDLTTLQVKYTVADKELYEGSTGAGVTATRVDAAGEN